MDQPQQPPASPATKILRFQTPQHLIVYLEADNCVKACLSAAEHSKFVQMEGVAAAFLVKAKEFEVLRDGLGGQQGIIVAPAGSVPNIKGT